MNRRPPRLADWLLRHALPPGERGDTMRGDLLEEFHGGQSSTWLWRQTLSLTIRYGARPRHRRVPRRNRMLFESLWQDVRYTVRAYAKTPSFTLAVLATL